MIPRELDGNETVPLNLILCILYRISALDVIPRELDENETVPLNLILCLLYRISALDVIPRELDGNDTRLFEPPDLLRINVR